MLAAPNGTLEFTVGRGRGRIALAGQTFKISRKIPEDVFARGESRIVADLVDEEEHSATVALGIRQVLCVPLKLMRFLDRPGAEPEPTRIGVLYLDSRESGTLLATSGEWVDSTSCFAPACIDRIDSKLPCHEIN